MGWIASLASLGVGIYSAVDSHNQAKDALAEQKKFNKSYLAGLGPGQFESSNIASGLLEQLFSGQHGNELIDFITRRLPLSKAEKTSSRFFDRQAAPLVNEGISNLQSMYPFAKELVDTGFPTDLEGITSNELRRFRNETIPGIYESRFSSLGEGSGLNSLLNTSAADLGSTLGALSYARDEAATNRRVAGAPLAQSIFQAPAEFGLANFGTIGREGELARIRRESVRPGAAPPVPSNFNLFPMLSSVEQGQVFPVMPGAPGETGGAGTAALGALGNALSNKGLQNSVGNLSDYFSGGTDYGSYLSGNNFSGGSSLYGDLNFGASNYSGSGYNPGLGGSFYSGAGWGSTGLSNLGGTNMTSIGFGV